jgi:hypothetical protein
VRLWTASCGPVRLVVTSDPERISRIALSLGKKLKIRAI